MGAFFKNYPDLKVKASDIIDKKIIPLYDFHLHTKYTDGKCEVNQIFDRAIKEGIDVIIFTEHTETYKSERENWFKDYYIDIKKNQEKNKNLIKSFVQSMSYNSLKLIL